MVTKVTIRQKKISKGKHSLYLDFWPPVTDSETGNSTRREFLKKYVYDNPGIKDQKLHNKEVLQFAEQVRQKREKTLNENELLSDYEKSLLKKFNEEKRIAQMSFLEYFQQVANKRSGSTLIGWHSAQKYLKAFSGGDLTFEKLNERFCDEFKDYMIKLKNPKTEKAKLTQNSVFAYFSKFKAALRQAYRDGLLRTDLNARIESVKKSETRRNYLTLEELNRLAKTPCNNVILKRAALFSALTGLRHGDIAKLVWEEVQFIEDGHYLLFTQEKTGGLETMPISEQAFSLLGERKQPTDRIFDPLPYTVHSNRELAKWIGLAGITKEITFHSFRHTFAVNQLSKGTDIYTVSKMLGHKDLKTTQIYAKVLDQAKRDAANRIKLDM